MQPPIWRKPDDEDNVGDIEMWAAAQVIELAKMYLDGAIDLNHEAAFELLKPAGAPVGAVGMFLKPKRTANGELDFSVLGIYDGLFPDRATTEIDGFIKYAVTLLEKKILPELLAACHAGDCRLAVRRLGAAPNPASVANGQGESVLPMVAVLTATGDTATSRPKYHASDRNGCLSVLLEAGALLDFEKIAPFHMMIEATVTLVIEWKEIAAMFDWFIQHGADPKLAYGKNQSPIDALCEVTRLRPRSRRSIFLGTGDNVLADRLYHVAELLVPRVDCTAKTFREISAVAERQIIDLKTSRVKLKNRFKGVVDDTTPHEKLAAGKQGLGFCSEFQRDWIKLLRLATAGDEEIARLRDIDAQYTGESAAWQYIVDEAKETLRIEEVRRIARVRQKGRDKVLKAVAKTRERNWESFVNSINGFERNPKTMPSVGDWDGLEGEYFVLEEDAEDPELNPRPAEEPPAPLNTILPASIQPFAVNLDELKVVIFEELAVVEAIEEETDCRDVGEVARYFLQFRDHASGEDADELKAAVEERIGAFLEETEEPEPEPEPELSPQQPVNGDEDEVQAEVEGVANDGNDGFDRLDVPAVPSDRADSGVSPSPGPGSPAVAPVTPDVPTDPDSGASGFCEDTDEDDDEGKVPTRMIEEGNEEDDAEEEAPFDDADEAGDVAAPAGVDEDGGLEQALAEDISGIELTEHMTKWFQSGRVATPLKDRVLDQLARIGNGERTYCTAKPLKGCKLPIYESRVSFRGGGKRMLWQYRGPPPAAILVWYVVDHKHVSDKLRLIEKAYDRMVAESGDGDDEADAEAFALMPEVLINPESNTPMKVYTFLDKSDAGQSYSIDDFEDFLPPMRLTQQEKEIGLNPSTRVLLGRSGTGKTICITARMVMDRLANPDEPFLFATRSPTLVTHVGDLMRTTGHCDELMSFVDMTNFIRGVAIKMLQVENDASRPGFARTGVNRHWNRYSWVGYKEFVEVLWPATIMDKRHTVDPLEVWTQIRCFIKGGANAAAAGRPLTREEYVQTKRKRSSKDDADRGQIYDAFERYQRALVKERKWDDMDCALWVCWSFKAGFVQHDGAAEFLREHAIAFTQIYVDEVQDSTMTELSIMFWMARDPNSVFLAGDTAQTILEGADFQFSDLRSALHFIYDGRADASSSKPKHLDHNYRSHTGILDVAANLVRRMHVFFKDSVDKTNPDKGVARGPKPAFALGTAAVERALLDNRMVLLVRDEDRVNVEYKLRSDGHAHTVLGVRESKGLEYDRVCLYGYFGSYNPSGSSAKNRQRQENAWKTILKAEKDLEGGATSANAASWQMEHELKMLYTAITRCRAKLLFAEPGGNMPTDVLTRQEGRAWNKKAQESAQKWLITNDNLGVPFDMSSTSSQSMTVEEWNLRGADFGSQAMGALKNDTGAEEGATRHLELARDCFRNAKDYGVNNLARVDKMLKLLPSLVDVTDRYSKAYNKAAEAVYQETGEGATVRITEAGVEPGQARGMIVRTEADGKLVIKQPSGAWYASTPDDPAAARGTDRGWVPANEGDSVEVKVRDGLFEVCIANDTLEKALVDAAAEAFQVGLAPVVTSLLDQAIGMHDTVHADEVVKFNRGKSKGERLDPDDYELWAQCFKARHAFIADKVRRCQKLIADAAAKKLVGKRAGGRSD